MKNVHYFDETLIYVFLEVHQMIVVDVSPTVISLRMITQSSFRIGSLAFLL